MGPPSWFLMGFPLPLPHACRDRGKRKWDGSVTRARRRGRGCPRWPRRTRPEPIREPEEIYLVDRAQHHRNRALNNLVLDCGDREWALPAVRLRYIHPA